MISRNGQEPTQERRTVLFKANFAVSVYMTEHRRNLYNFTRLLSELGGLASAVFTILNVLGMYLNAEFLKSKITRLLYFVKSNHKVGEYNEIGCTQGHSPNEDHVDRVPLTYIKEFRYTDTI